MSECFELYGTFILYFPGDVFFCQGRGYAAFFIYFLCELKLNFKFEGLSDPLMFKSIIASVKWYMYGSVKRFVTVHIMRF